MICITCMNEIDNLGKLRINQLRKRQTELIEINFACTKDMFFLSNYRYVSAAFLQVTLLAMNGQIEIIIIRLSLTHHLAGSRTRFSMSAERNEHSGLKVYKINLRSKRYKFNVNG